VLLIAFFLAAQDSPGQQGQNAESLAASLQLTLVKEQNGSKFQLELRNTTDHDLVLNLGVMLANGASQYPNAVVFRLTCPDGKQLPLQMIQPAFIAGRLDPMVVPLPRDATFILPINLLDYWAVEGKKVSQLDLLPGSYSLRAIFTGTDFPGQAANLDMKGIALMPYWKGTLESSDLAFELRDELKKEGQ
jgi:hypothetical protein